MYFLTMAVLRKTSLFPAANDVLFFWTLHFHLLAPSLAPVVFEADHSTQVRLRDYVINHVFEDLEEEEQGDEDGKINKNSVLTIYHLRRKITEHWLAETEGIFP